MTPRSGYFLTLACLTATSLVALAGQNARAEATMDQPPGRIRIEKGQDLTQVLQAAMGAATQRRLRANWLAAGHSMAEAAAGRPLALYSGTVLSNTLEVGDPFAFPAVSFGFSTGTAGLSQASFTFSSPVGPATVVAQYVPPFYTTGGTAAFAYPAAFPYYAAPGTWTLSAATLYDNAGNETVYTAKQLAALFSGNTLTVINDGPVDGEPPVLGAGHLLNTTVSLSAALPQLIATLAVSDAGTGVASAFLFVQPPGQSYYFGEIVTIPLPVKSGTIRLYNSFNPEDPTGTWTIKGYQICDVALNCINNIDPATVFKKFGANTFTVTK